MRFIYSTLFLFSLLLYSNFEAAGQYQLLDASWRMGAPIKHVNREYGNGVSFYDVNKDGLDDITFPAKNDSLIILISNGDTFTRIKPIYCNGESKMALWGDYDNDGDADLFLGFYEAPIKLYRNDGDFNFTDVTSEMGLNVAPKQTYGASWGDINNDGWLDLLVINYDFPIACSWLFKNNGGTGFSEIGNEYGINVESGFSFQGTFFDINHDGLQDIHIANDKVPNDAVLINQESYFQNVANISGLNEYCESMTSSVADYNNDGNFDVYVTNSDFGNFLWKNNGNTEFTNLAEDTGVELNRSSWGASWIDLNNDAWEDLYVNYYPMPGDEPAFFMNATGSFSQLNEVESEDENWYSFASAKGDFNNDGKYDLAITRDNSVPYMLLENTTTTVGNWVKINLEGQVSNRDGVGTLLDYQINDHHYFRYAMSGSAYLSQDSQWIILGMGDAELIESLKVTWLSGQVDEYFNLQAGTVLTLKEGAEVLQLAFNGQPANDTLHICSGEQIELYLPSNNPVFWSNGGEGNQLLVGESGWYYGYSVNPLGIVNTSDSVYVEVSSIDVPQITVQHVSCAGASDGEILFSLNESLQIVNNAGVVVSENGWHDLAPGDYMIQFSSGLCSVAQEVYITEPEPITFETVTSDISCFQANDGQIEVESITGGGLEYFITIYSEMGEELSNGFGLPEGQYEVVVHDQNDCSSFQYIVLHEPDPLVISLEQLNAPGWYSIAVSGGTPPYNILFNGLAIPNNYSVFAPEIQNEIFCLDQNNCSATLPFESTVINGMASFDDSPNNCWFADGTLRFKSPVMTLKVYNMQGQLVYSDSSLKISEQLNFAPGIYLINYADSFGTFTKKITFD